MKPTPRKSYSKSMGATATLKESAALADAATFPAFVAARFALILSIVALLVSAVTLAVVLSR